MDQIWRLKHFLAVAEAGSVQGAARCLHISQPALSKSLRLLEEHLQTALFDRSARGVVLTPMGQVLYLRAREIQSEWEASLIELNATRDGAQGELRIGMGPTYAVVLMRRVLAQLARDYPNLRVSVRTGVGALLIPALQAGEISLYAGGLGTFEEHPGEGLEELCPLNVSGYEWTIRSGVTYRSSMRSLEPVKAILQMLKQDVARLGFA